MQHVGANVSDTSAPSVSGHLGTSADMSYGHFGTGADVSWVRSVCTVHRIPYPVKEGLAMY